MQKYKRFWILQYFDVMDKNDVRIDVNPFFSFICILIAYEQKKVPESVPQFGIIVYLCKMNFTRSGDVTPCLCMF